MTPGRTGRISPHKRNRIMLAYAAGVKVEAIAAEYGVSHTYPAKTAKRLGLPRRANRGKAVEMASVVHSSADNVNRAVGTGA